MFKIFTKSSQTFLKITKIGQNMLKFEIETL